MQMVDSYSNFMIFKLKNNGERVKLSITEDEFIKDNAAETLDSTQVLIIIKEEIRRIYIWKGYESSVRKKFIASRVARDLQNELIQYAHYHRCKIISVDQGDEPDEFLKTFNLKQQKIERIEEKVQDIQEDIIKSSVPISRYFPQRKIKTTPPPNYSHKSTESRKKMTGINDTELLEKILNIEQTPNYKRKHILIGIAKLYGLIKKKSEVFGQQIEKEEWEEITKFPKEIIELNNYKLRIHINPQNKNVNAIEILKNISKVAEKKVKIEYDFEKWTVAYLRQFCKEHNIKIPSGCKKNDILKNIRDYVKSQ